METNLTRDFFDSVGKAYESTYAGNACLLDFLKGAVEELPKGSMILDVGCGTGKPVSSTLAAHGYRVTGIDRSKVMIDLCRTQVPGATFEQVDMLDYDPGTKFGAIFAVFCTFALSRAQTVELLRKLSQWLLPKGKLYIVTIAADDYPTEPSHYDTDGLYASGMDNEFMGQTVTISLLSKQGWETFLGKEGLQILETTTHEFDPGAQCGKEQHYFIKAEKVVK